MGGIADRNREHGSGGDTIAVAAARRQIQLRLRRKPVRSFVAWRKFVKFKLTKFGGQVKIYKMDEVSKFVFGTDIRHQVAERIQAHIAAKFDSNGAKAAKSLGITRQRLFSYTSATTLPRPPIFDLILQRWGLNLLGRRSQLKSVTSMAAVPIQPALFDEPITLTSEGMKVVIKRKGPRVVASIEISTNVRIA